MVVLGNTNGAVMAGGWNDWQYAFRPDMLPLPEKANVEHAHGIVIDGEGTIVITYKDALDDSQCLLRWDGDYKSTAKFIGHGKELCAGVPHGLRSSIEEGSMVLYHANNEQSLHKTTMDYGRRYYMECLGETKSQHDREF